MEELSLSRVTSGLAGLDDVLHGGFVAGRHYLVRGPPGTGKTILGFHFLTAGDDEETALMINVEESTSDVRDNAGTLGFDLDGIEFLDLSPESTFFGEDQSYDVFAPDEVEREPVLDRIRERVDAVDPDRVFVDPLTQLRYLAPDEYQFRKQTLSFMRYLKECGATVLYTAQGTPTSSDIDLQFLSDGIVELDHGDDRRTIAVPKFRGSDRQGGTHALRIDDDGLAVFPELIPDDYSQTVREETIPSGVSGLDSLLRGGLERGTTSVISGPTGVGKTTTGALFAEAAASGGDRAAIYLFEESRATFSRRLESIGVPITAMEDEGALAVEQVEPLTRSAEEFAQRVRREVEQRDTDVVMIDGIDGYTLSIQGEAATLRRKLHALCRYLKNVGVTVILIDEIDGVAGEFRATDAGISYLADNVVFLRYYEIDGEIRKAIGVLKKRISGFENTLRAFEITDEGVVVGDSLSESRGMLRGAATSHDRSRHDG